jgi:hypothetical protein
MPSKDLNLYDPLAVINSPVWPAVRNTEDAMRAVIEKSTAAFFAEDKDAIDVRYTAVKFRGRIYVAGPRHMDAINLAFDGMTQQQKHRVCNRIADGKETIQFGSARGDGTEWEWNEEFQNARMRMYGFD